MLDKPVKIVAGLTFISAALGCCWATIPNKPSASLIEAYREIGLARECSHRPHKCMSRDFHAQRLLVDEHCTDTPICQGIHQCMMKYCAYIYTLGCSHPIPCDSAIVHFNAVRCDQGLSPLELD